MKISKDKSLTLSLWLAGVLFVGCIVGLFVLPSLVELLLALPDRVGDRENITLLGKVLVYAMAYGIVLTVIEADTALWFILMRVKNRLVFTDFTVQRIRIGSWGCIVLSGEFGVLTIYFQLSFILCFLAVFLGLSIRGVKNVMEEATALKTENDLTV